MTLISCCLRNCSSLVSTPKIMVRSSSVSTAASLVAATSTSLEAEEAISGTSQLSHDILVSQFSFWHCLQSCGTVKIVFQLNTQYSYLIFTPKGSI